MREVSFKRHIFVYTMVVFILKIWKQFYDTFAKHRGDLEKKEGNCNVKWQFMVANYEIVKIVAILMKRLSDKFTKSVQTLLATTQKKKIWITLLFLIWKVLSSKTFTVLFQCQIEATCRRISWKSAVLANASDYYISFCTYSFVANSISVLISDFDSVSSLFLLLLLSSRVFLPPVSLICFCLLSYYILIFT